MRLRRPPRSVKPGSCLGIIRIPAQDLACCHPAADAIRKALWPLGLGLLLPAMLASACNPYERHSDEYLAGSVDPVKFPADYLGSGGDPKTPGSGTFRYVTARVNKQTVSYYPLPFSSAQADSPDPLDLGGLALPRTYVFDPQPGSDGAAADSARCVRPDGYVYDELERREQAFRRDRQGNLFTQLPAPRDSDDPTSSTDLPVVREVVVTSKGNPCQSIKSEANLLGRTDVGVSLAPPSIPTPGAPPVARPSGRLLAMAIIDPAADVRYASPMMPHDEETGLGPQRWGFYAQYLLAYLDGGYIPQQVVAGPKDPAGTRRMVAQNLYYPATIVVDAMGNTGPGEVGQGFDVLEFRRGTDGYSPVCRLWQYEPLDPLKPATSVAEIDPATVTDTGRYIYCLQLP